MCPIAHYREHSTYLMPKGDYFHVLVNKAGLQGVLDKLDELTDNERLVTAASTYAAIREGE